MYDSPTDVELIARHQMRARARQAPQLPVVRRRARLARTLRRAADRLDG